MPKRKNPHAVALGRRGGKAKTEKLKGLAAMTPEKRAKISRAGVEARKNARNQER